ncbi:glycosyltransferase family 1 protein [Anabaena catenula]|uniref:Glycosyltransferase family 1 protein n=1 Tax=Anabaena catenula FACHB-362 TaxID=2692877 RepID=A0ABR8IZL5_9NOST|nr:glycosyltransferase family 1 protein [Anabaena catenula]MBD2691506.1 glycosyltransferase family 1 protein [Anabaena catenula FACHB-362]
MVITVIVPRLPPAVDGVGDYGLNLAKQMRQDFGVVTKFIIGDANWSGEAVVEGFAVKQVADCSYPALLELLPHQQNSAQTVLLHYVGYGYARRGCPVWLVEGLEKWRKQGNNRRLVTMFHELYAFGAIWTSQFWTSPLQRNLAARLVCLSDRTLTSKQGYADIISKFSQGKHFDIPTLPVFSNVGEPEYLTSLSSRSRRLVVFGGMGQRSRVYQQSLLALQRTCQELEIEEILDIGPALKFEIEPVNNIPVTCLGVKSAQEISSLLSTSLVGFFNYSIEYLTKSGIFAAYCAHKLLPIGIWYEGKDVDGLEAGKHYWLADKYQNSMNLSVGQIVADNAYAWYQNHRLSAQAQTFVKYLK